MRDNVMSNFTESNLLLASIAEYFGCNLTRVNKHPTVQAHPTLEPLRLLPLSSLKLLLGPAGFSKSRALAEGQALTDETTKTVPGLEV